MCLPCWKVGEHLHFGLSSTRTYLAPAPLPAPATPFPAAVTMAPVKLPMPDAAWLPILDSQPCCWGGCFGGFTFGRGFDWVLGAGFGTGFFAGAPVLGSAGFAFATGAFLTGAFVCGFTGVFFTGVGPGFGAAFGACLGGIVVVC